MQKILALVGALSGVDFSLYKPNMVKRRVLRRAALARVVGLGEYLHLLENNPAEAQALYRDLVINVTQFFREPDVFNVLRSDILPRVLQNKPHNAAIRIWVPGCSTGEEVYSYAITVLEVLGEHAADNSIQIFGTDISDDALEQARTAIYPQSIDADVSADRLRRFFLKRDGGYQLAKPVRDLCVFARHNVFKDPPLSNLDIISCRNVLIYFGQDLQKLVLRIFHYALNENGHLVLSSSEGIGGYADYFGLALQKPKIYFKKSTALQPSFEFSRSRSALGRRDAMQSVRNEVDRLLEPQREADRMILDQYGPPCVLIDGDMNILQFRGNTTLYLAPAPGNTRFNLLHMAREGLTAALHTAVQDALATQSPVRHGNIRVGGDGRCVHVDLHVMPLPAQADSRDRFLLVLFENGRSDDQEQLLEPAAGAAPAPLFLPEGENLLRLRQEFTATKEYLQSIIESRENFNEELCSANEEILSTNEELTALNEELQMRNSDLAMVSDDLSSLLDSINLAIVLLDSHLRVRRFTPLAEKLMNMEPSDIGRAFDDIDLTIVAPGLIAMIRDALGTLRVREMEVRDRQGHWYNLQVRPYKTLENCLGGVLLTLADIQLAKRNVDRAQGAAAYWAAYSDAMHEAVVVLTHDLHIKSANRAFCNRYQTTPEQIQQRRINELGDSQLNSQTLRRLLQDILPRELSVDNFELDTDSTPSRMRMRVNARRIVLEKGHEPVTLLAIAEREGSVPH